MIKFLIMGSIVVTGLFFFVRFLINLDERQEAEWQLYKSQHHCILNGRKAGQISSTFGIGIDSNGQAVPVIGTSTIPSQDIYTCDKGEVIIR